MNAFQSFLLLCLFITNSLFIASCTNDDEELAVEEQNCLVEVNGEFTDVDLDQDPMYIQGGQDSFVIHLLKEIKYPAAAREQGVEGRSTISYIITDQGQVINFEILEDPGAGIGESFRLGLEVTTEGVSFTPGIFQGSPVNVKKELSALFRLL